MSERVSEGEIDVCASASEWVRECMGDAAAAAISQEQQKKQPRNNTRAQGEESRTNIEMGISIIRKNVNRISARVR